MKDLIFWHISGESLRSYAHVPMSTLRFGARHSSETALKTLSLKRQKLNLSKVN